MSNVVKFRLPPQVVLELLGTDHSGKPVYSTRFVDTDGYSLTDYLGHSYIDALRSAAAFVDDGARLVDRIAGGVRA